ncbi:MAG: hypothetical protein LBR46_03085 [Prevotella sp.]|jgi:hypothetical protein|nr:hypothetical protein [Prevotella sp.]
MVKTESNSATSETELYVERIKENDKQIHRLLNFYQTGLLSIEYLPDNISPLKEEKQKLEKLIKEHPFLPRPINPTKAWNLSFSFDDIIGNGDREEIHRNVHS